jgi:hypothetical protein
VLINAGTLQKEQRMIAGCESCNKDIEIPFVVVLGLTPVLAVVSSRRDPFALTSVLLQRTLRWNVKHVVCNARIASRPVREHCVPGYIQD